MGSSELERCKKSLRSILLANKGGVPAQKILKEYYSLYEEEIPYKRFNHPTLEKFLMSIPDVCVISSRRGEVVVEGVASSGTSHIERLVQKTAGKRGGAPAGGGGGWRGNHPPATSLRKAAALGISQTGGRSHAASAYAFSRRSAGLSQSQAPSASTFARSNPSKFYGQNKSTSTPNPKRSSAVPANLNALEVMLNGLKCHSDSNVIPAMDKPLKKEWDLQITAVEASNEVWVSLTSSLEAKKQLEAELRRSHCSSSGGFNGGTLPPGNYFSAELEPGQVRRVRVIRLDRINYTAHCLLIDYGKELEVPWAKLVPLKQEFWSTKALAMKIQLFEFVRYHNVEVLEFAKKRLEGRRVFGREVREAQPLNGCSVPLVSIFEADPAGDLMFIENVIQDMKLISRGHAVNGGDKLSNGISSSSAVTPVQVSQDQGVLQQPELPGADEFYDCVVSHVVGASEIYVRSHHSNAAYCSLQHQLLAFYSAGHGRAAQTAEPASVGAEWFRVRILKRVKALTGSKASKDFLVRLVDTGKVELVSLSSMKILEKQFFSLPSQAVRADLDGIKKGGEEATVWLREVCRGKSLVGHVIARQGERLSIVLYDTTVEDLDININKEMIDLGLTAMKEA